MENLLVLDKREKRGYEMLKPEDQKFMDTLKKTHYFILESVHKNNDFLSAKSIYQSYKSEFKTDALEFDIFKEAHETIRQCFNILLTGHEDI